MGCGSSKNVAVRKSGYTRQYDQKIHDAVKNSSFIHDNMDRREKNRRKEFLCDFGDFWKYIYDILFHESFIYHDKEKDFLNNGRAVFAYSSHNITIHEQQDKTQIKIAIVNKLLVYGIMGNENEELNQAKEKCKAKYDQIIKIFNGDSLADNINIVKKCNFQNYNMDSVAVNFSDIDDNDMTINSYITVEFS